MDTRAGAASSRRPATGPCRLPMNRPRLRWTWILVPSAAILVFVCGVAGFGTYFREIGRPKTLADLFYLTGQLFTMNSGAVEGRVPGSLEVARFVAPLVAAYALISAVFALFSVEFRRWGLRFRRGHVIVCGLGRKGSRLVEELRREGHRVAVIEPDEHNPGLPHCRDLKVTIIPGRSDSDWNLVRAQINRAGLLIATAGSDAVNIETVVRAHAFAQRRRRGRLQCVAHLTDPALQQLLKSHRIFDNREDPFDLELVNVYEAGARIMLERAGLSLWPVAGETERRLCLVGLGHFGESVVRRLLRDWAVRLAEAGESDPAAPGAAPVLDIVIVDREAEAKEPSIRQRYAEFLSQVRLHFVTRDVRGPDFAGPTLAVTLPEQRMEVFFICFDDDSLSTLAAIRIRDRFDPGIPIIVRMTEQAGFASLLESGPASGGSLSGIRPIGFMDIACMRDLFLGGDLEVLGRALHDAYLEERRLAGKTAADNPNIVPWHQLDETGRDSNRTRASDIRDQLDQVGLLLAPCPDRPVRLHRFSPAALDTLARLEHDRWRSEKAAAGWSYGPQRDDARRLNPYLVAWDRLPEPEREFNRASIRRLPAILARADFEVREKPAAGPAGPRPESSPAATAADPSPPADLP